MKKFTLITLLLMSILAMAQDRTIRRGGGGGGGGGGSIADFNAQFGTDAAGKYILTNGANVTNLVHQGDFDLNGGIVMLNTASIRGDDSANTTIEIAGDTITFTASAGDGMTYDSSGLTILTDDLTLDSGSLNVSAASVSANGFVDSSATGNFALATDGSLNIVESASTDTELGYLSGVTSGIQGQLNAKGTVGDVVAAMTQATKWEMIVPFGDESTSHTAGADKFTFNMPRAITLTGVKVNLNTAATGATLFTVDLHEAGVSVLSTKITLTSGSRTSVGAATAPVISDSALADDAIMTIDIDSIGNTLPGVGGKLTLIGTRN